MSLLRVSTAVVVWLVVAACDVGPTHHGPSRRVPDVSHDVTSGDPELAFPGGGRILFLPSEGPGYGWHGVGIVVGDGSVHYLPRHLRSFPYWDPAAADRILMLPWGPPAETGTFEIVGDSLRQVDTWRTAELSTYPSLDGMTIAFTPIDRSGRPRRRVLRLIDRVTGATQTVSSHGLVPLAWTPGRELLAVPWSGGQVIRWNPWTGATKSFGSGLWNVVWDQSGGRFAANATTRGAVPQSLVVIGDRRGRVATRVMLGAGSVEMPTWSPDGTRIAFIVRGKGRAPHRRSSLHVYDLILGIDSVVAKPVSDAFWASWSPDGEWLLVDDWTRERWLFVAAAGNVRFAYPWLGAFPRWCCPSSPPSSTTIPVS